MSGVATFAGLSLDDGSMTYELQATCSGCPVQDSNVVVVYERAASLAFGTEPSHDLLSGAGFTAQPVVHILDFSGFIITDGPDSSLTVLVEPTDAGELTLGGTTSVGAGGLGVATFNGLTATLESSKMGVTMTAKTVSPALSVESAVFTVYRVATSLTFDQQPVGDVLENEFFSQLPVVSIRDAFGSVVTAGPHSSLDITVTSVGAAGLLTGSQVESAASGVASGFVGLAISQSSTGHVLRATLSGAGNPAVDSAPFTIWAIATSLSFSTQPSTTDVLTGESLTVAPVVDILDSLGGRILLGPHAVLDVTLVGSGLGSVTAASPVMTAVAGRAGPFLNVAADRQGSYTLDASTAGPSLLVTSNAFTIFGLAASLSIVQQPTSGDLSQVALVNDPSVEILDVYDDLIATGPHSQLTITASDALGGSEFSLSGGAAAVAATGGRVDFAGLVPTLTSSATSVEMRFATSSPALAAVSVPFTVFQIATAVVFTVQPTGDVLENAVLPTMPEVHIHDQFGGLVSTGPHSALTVALSRTGGTGVLQGTATAGASGGVVDTYAGLALTLSSTTYRLRATLLHGSNPTVDSDMFTIFAIATSIVFSTQPAATNVLTDQDLTVAPVVEILDTLGARVVLGPHAVLSVAVAKSAGGLGLLSQGTTVVSASAGLAGPFSGIQFDRQSTYSLQATTGVPALSVTSNSFVVHGFAFELQFQTQPVGNCRPVDPLVTQPVVRLFDSYGDQILTGPHSMLDVTLTETLTPAVVTGTTTVTASGGDAVFTDVGIDRGGDFVARASTALPTLTVNSAPFIIYGVASHLSFCTQPVANVLPHELFPTQPEVCVLDVHSNVVEYGPDTVRDVDLGITGGALLGHCDFVQRNVPDDD